MLVLSRRPGSKLYIGDDVTITVCRIGPSSVRLGVDCPRHMDVWRDDAGPRKHSLVLDLDAAQELAEGGR